MAGEKKTKHPHLDGLPTEVHDAIIDEMLDNHLSDDDHEHHHGDDIGHDHDHEDASGGAEESSRGKMVANLRAAAAEISGGERESEAKAMEDAAVVEAVAAEEGSSEDGGVVDSAEGGAEGVTEGVAE